MSTPTTHISDTDQPARTNQRQTVSQLLAAIVGFEIDIERLEGKWKLNQNHPAERRSQIIRGLQSTGRHEEVQIAELMQATLEAS